MRRNQFTVDAESVQGVEGAEVTFRAIHVREWTEYRATPMSDQELVTAHIISWKGFVNDDGKPLPDVADEPAILGELYMHEMSELGRLLVQGPDGISAKN